jgi:predicted SAM-dependent methyltransferase
VGCGDLPHRDGWTDCDCWPDLEPEVVMDASRPWPFYDDSAGRIFLGQVLEHLSYPQGVRRCLEEAARVLAPTGMCLVICPDSAAFDEKRVSLAEREQTRQGRRRWPGDAHRWLPNRFTVGAELCRCFETVRAVNVTNIGDDWPHGARVPWDCAFVAWGTADPPAS